jgi:uncharacterized MAPEG superfamily protein
MSIPVAALLAFAVWTIVLLTFTIGVVRWGLIFTGKAELKSFPGDEPHGSAFYRRATRAHANCIENLPVFGAIVFAAEASGAHSSTLDVLAVAVVIARVCQTSAHLSSGSNAVIGIRFSFLAVQLVAFFWMSALIVLHALPV